MGHKNDYSVIAFFDNQKPKKWSFIHKLSTFGRFLEQKHPDWTYLNVYDRRNKSYLRRFYRDEVLPDFL